MGPQPPHTPGGGNPSFLSFCSRFAFVFSDRTVGIEGLMEAIRFLRNPTQYLQEQRRALGDVFVLRLFGLKLFFVFSRAGLAEFYSVAEDRASFLEATRGFLG